MTIGRLGRAMADEIAKAKVKTPQRAAVARQRARSTPLEYAEQAAIFEWARNPLVLKAQPDLIMLKANNDGLKLSMGMAMKAKRAGSAKGFPDIELLVVRTMNDEHCRNFGVIIGGLLYRAGSGKTPARATPSRSNWNGIGG